MKIIIALMLLAIFASLFSALFFLFQDEEGSTRTVKALTYRISLSIVLFISLMLAHYFGLLGK
ncbi:MAG: twin transmembrane helix small protein [Rugosibacter sp.]|nr:twin transmembrane helix small protein [Rugosibacter sp.]